MSMYDIFSLLLALAIVGGAWWLLRRVGVVIAHRTPFWAFWVAAGVIALPLTWWFPGFELKGLAVVAFVAWYAVAYKAIMLVGKLGINHAANSDHLRGNQLVEAKDVKRMLRGVPANIKIGGVPLPVDLEPRNMLCVGAPGTGKSQAIHAVLTPVRAAGQRALIADVGGEFVARYFRDGDVVINPFDERGVDWSPLAEMRGPWDAERIARSIVPDGQGSAAEWNGYSQTLLAAVLLRQYESGEGTNGQILRLLTQAPASELKTYVAGLPAAGMFAEGGERMLSSIQGILSSYIKPFQYLNPSAGAQSFSIRNWLENESGSWLFLSFTDSQLASIKALVAAALDIGISALLELKPDAQRRVWFVIDEFATLGTINSIGDLLTKGRKYGGAAVLGMQSISQPREAYGRERSQTLLSCLGTWLVLRCPDAETAEYMSVYLGDEEYRRVVVSESQGGYSLKDPLGMSSRSTNTSEEIRTRRVAMPSELQNLQDRVGILNIVGDIPPCTVVVDIIPGQEVAERFVRKQPKQQIAVPADAEAVVDPA